MTVCYYDVCSSYPESMLYDAPPRRPKNLDNFAHLRVDRRRHARKVSFIPATGMCPKQRTSQSPPKLKMSSLYGKFNKR